MIQQVSKTCISCQTLRVEPKRTQFGKLITLEQFSVKKFANVCFYSCLFWMDTTSHIYGVGKSVLLKKCNKDENIRQLASIFRQPEVTHDTVQIAGENIPVALYNGAKIQSLDILRYCKFLQKVQTKSTALHVQSLPPTSDAAIFHSYNTFLQTQLWSHNDMDPLQWGWEKENNRLVPRKATLPAAPTDC